MADEENNPLEKNQPIDKFSENFKESIDNLRDAVTHLGDKLTDTLKGAIKDTDLLNDGAKRVAKIYTNDISKSLDKIGVSLDTQYDLGNKISKGIDITKDILKERERLEKESEIIRRRLLILDKAGVEIEVDVREELEKRLNLSETILKVLHEENKERTESLGLTGKLASGIDGILEHIDKSGKLSKVLDIEGAVEKTREFAAKSEQPVGSFTKLGVLSKNVGKNLISGIKGIDFLTIAIEQLIEAIIHTDKEIGSAAKSLGVSYDQAFKLKSELSYVASISSDIYITTAKLLETFDLINESLGTRAQINKNDLRNVTLLVERAGISKEIAVDLYKLSQLTGKNTKSLTTEIYGQIGLLQSRNKISFNYKTLLGEISKTSAAIQISLGRSGINLTTAVVKAKELGTSLEKVDQIANSLLDFESSISAQIQAELLTGKQLNLERARAAALNNDLATLSEEIKNNIGSTAEFSQMNRIAQESIAKAMGLTREELAEILKQQDLLSGTKYKDINEAQEDFNKLLAKGFTIEQARARLGNQALADQLASVSMQEEFTQTIEKLKEVFISLAKPILQIIKPIADILAPVLATIGNIVQTNLLPVTTALSVAFKGIGKILMPLQHAFDDIGKIFSEIFGGKNLGDFNKFLKETTSLLNRGVLYPIIAIGKAFTSVIGGSLKSVFGILGGIVDILKGDFSEGLEKIGKSIISLIVSPFQLAMDVIISGINGLIKLSNKVGDSIIPGYEKIKEFKHVNLADKITGDNKKVEKADDLISYGKKTIVTPEGSIKLNDKDTIIAGTKLLDTNVLKSNKIEPQTSKIDSNINKEKIIEKSPIQFIKPENYDSESEIDNNIDDNKKEISKNAIQTINNFEKNKEKEINNFIEKPSKIINNNTVEKEKEISIKNEENESVKELQLLNRLFRENNRILNQLLVAGKGDVNLDSSKVGEILSNGPASFSI